MREDTIITDQLNSHLLLKDINPQAVVIMTKSDLFFVRSEAKICVLKAKMC
jgi:hypothetical protein